MILSDHKIPCSGNHAGRGRNGWFKLDRLHIHIWDDKVEIRAYSRHVADLAPIYMELDYQEARELARVLSRV